MPVFTAAYVFPDDPNDEAVMETGRFLIGQLARQHGIDPADLIVRRTYDERHVAAWVAGDQFPTIVPLTMLSAMRVEIPPGSAYVRLVRWEARPDQDGTGPRGIDLRSLASEGAYGRAGPVRLPTGLDGPSPP